MKALLRLLAISAFCLAANTGSGEDKAGGEEKAQKEIYTLVKITKLNKTVEIKVLNRAELAEMRKKLRYEAMVIGQAFKQAATEWSKADADGKKGPPFPLMSQPSARVLTSLGSFSDIEKASAAQAKIEKAASVRKSKGKDDKRAAKQAEKEQEQEDAYGKLQSKIEELAWAKETEAASAGNAAKKGGE